MDDLSRTIGLELLGFYVGFRTPQDLLIQTRVQRRLRIAVKVWSARVKPFLGGAN